MPARSFGARLGAEFASGRRLCVGIDPHRYLLESWSLPDTAAGAEQMGLRIVAAAIGQAAAVKPQVAFFERFGSAGYVALETVFAAAREAQLIVIADAKRGDVGSSFDAYADAWLQPGSPLEADALTASAFQGFGVLNRALEHTTQHGKGLFVLAATSNPEAESIQTARLRSDETVSAHLLGEINEFNRTNTPGASNALGSVGAVLGATIDLMSYGVDVSAALPVGMPVLAPGFGHQGGSIDVVKRQFGSYFDGVLVSESRSLIDGGASELEQRIHRRARELADVFEEAGR